MNWRQTFELGGANRLLPMEGVRGLAVGLVFLQHYSTQFLEKAELGGSAAWFATRFRLYGNLGVELFFVLSGFLIYGLLLRRRPGFRAFLARRAQRLYPAFLVAFCIGAVLDMARPQAKIPSGFADATIYLAANLLFLPGLFPIEPLFAVNWSLSYEWWFYVGITLIVLAGFATLARPMRIAGIVALGGGLLSLSAAGWAHVPVRGLPLLTGMLLAELSGKSMRVPAAIGFAAFLAAFAAISDTALPVWTSALLIAVGFTLLCAAAFRPDGITARAFSWRWLRWFGNMSYSYYLVHGFVVVIMVELAARVLGRTALGIIFWPFMVPVFISSAIVGGALFLLVERPFSLASAAPVP